ncbi:reticulon-3 [Rhinatrema bivittatum]|uniref:reticulon-3 n=1 Tax=Rhinatrema bivittatum TaxID=194408 RepID=UPI00112D7F9B|nr:reticulon-3 [Rhinatrema bivittatum]
MADNAAQSPYISSSHGSGGEPSSRPATAPHTEAPCAVSARDGELASRPVMFKERRKCSDQIDISCGTSADSGTSAISSGILGLEFSLTMGTDAHLYNPFIPTRSVEKSRDCDSFFFKKDGELECIGSQDLKHSTTDELDFCVLQEQNQFKGEQISTKPTEVMSPGEESPDSPFEVIADKTLFEFHGSFGDLSDFGGSMVKNSEAEWLTASVLQRRSREVQLRTQSDGSVPTSAELHTSPPSYSSTIYQDQLGYASDMQHMPSNLSNWDFIPKIEKDEVKTSGIVYESLGSDTAIPDSENKIADLQGFACVKIQENLWCPGDHSITKTKKPDECAEVSQVSSLQSSAVVLTLSMSANEEEVGDPCGSMKNTDLFRSASSTPPNQGTPSGNSLNIKPLPDTYGMKSDSNAVDTDSSGESDDTIMEDAAAYLVFKNKTKRELQKAFNISSAMKPASVVKAVETGLKIKEDLPNKLSKYNERDGQLYKITENHILEVETVPGSLEACPVRRSVKVAKIFTGTSTSSKDVNKVCDPYEVILDKSLEIEASKISTEVAKKLNKTTFLSSFESIADPEQGKVLDEESFMDFMKEYSTVMSESGQHHQKTTPEANQAGAETSGLFNVTTSARTAMEGDSVTSELKDMVAVDGKYNAQYEKTGLDFEQEQQTIKALKEVSMSLDEEYEGISTREKTLMQKFENETTLVVKGLSWAQETSGLLPVFGPGPHVLEELLVPKKTSYEEMNSKVEPTKDHVVARLLAKFSVRDLIFWRDMKKTGAVFGTSLIILLSLAAFSIISVVAYLILAVLSVTITFRIYRSVVQAVQKSEEGHPFRSLLDVDLHLSSEAFHKYMSAILGYINKVLKMVVRLFLVEDLVDSLKLAVFMWLMTYIGAVFNGITLLILAELLIFSLPIVYEKYQTRIDHYVALVRGQTKSIIAKVQAKVPGLGKKKAE